MIITTTTNSAPTLTTMITIIAITTAESLVLYWFLFNLFIHLFAFSREGFDTGLCVSLTVLELTL